MNKSKNIKYFKENKQDFSITGILKYIKKLVEAAKRLRSMVSEIPSIKEVFIIDLTVEQSGIYLNY